MEYNRNPRNKPSDKIIQQGSKDHSEGEKIISSTNGAGETGDPCAK